MKKWITLLVCTLVCVGATAGVQLRTDRVLQNHRSLMGDNAQNDGQDKGPFHLMTTQPEGELKLYDRAGQTLDGNNGTVSPKSQIGKCSIVYAPDGVTVYMKDPISGYLTGAWVKGTIDGNIITIPLGQELEYNNQYNAYVVLTFGTTYFYEEDGATYIEINDDGYEVATFTIEGNTISLNGSAGDINAGGNDAYIATGLACKWSDIDSWAGDLDMHTVLTEVEPVVDPYVIKEIPDGILKSYTRTGGYIYHQFVMTGIEELDDVMNVVFADNDKVYIQNPVAWLSNGNWVEGTLDAETGIISVPTGQYVAWFPDRGYGGQLMWGSSWFQQIGYDYGSPVYYLYAAHDASVAEIKYKLEGNTITLLNSSGNVWAPYPEWGNTTGLYLMYSDTREWAGSIEFGTECTLSPNGPAVPANPVALDWIDWGNENGYSRFFFTLPTTDVDGNPLDPEKISYSIFTDNDQIFTFQWATYFYDVVDDMTVIPYEIYSDGFDICSNVVYFYRTNAEGYVPFFDWRIGIQVYYTAAGITYSSDIVYLEVFPQQETAVDELLTEKTVANVRYYNAMGQELTEPQGLAIQVTTFTDGTISKTKIMK